MPEQAKRSQDNLKEIWEELVVSILAVNQYSLEKTYAILPLLREVGIVDPDNLASWELDEVIARLRAGGCERGSFMTSLFALRLVSLGTALKSKGIASCGEIILTNDAKAIRDLLMPVDGIGPRVLSNFFLLRGIKEEK